MLARRQSEAYLNSVAVSFNNKQMEESRMIPRLIRKTLFASSIAMALGATNAQAALVTDLFGPYNWSTNRRKVI